MWCAWLMELDAITAELPADPESAHTSSRKSAGKRPLLERFGLFRVGGAREQLIGVGLLVPSLPDKFGQDFCAAVCSG